MSKRNSNGRRRVNQPGSEFSIIYSNWLQVRRDTLKELRTLVEDLHREQLEYNKAQIAVKEIGRFSRTEKNSDSTVGFIASIAAFMSDAASGIVSVVQACDVDKYQKKFQEIWDADSEVTEKLYAARSRMDNYHDIEEVRRKYNFSTFDSTVGNISNALKMDKYAARYDYEEDDISKSIGAVGGIIDSACQIDNLRMIGGSLGKYTNDNPAVLEACKAATRTVFGVAETFTTDEKKKSELRSGIGMFANHLMTREDNREIARLQTAVDHDLSQTKLETRIKEAINTLQSEMQEISRCYNYLDHRR